jgi:hypothetical protein
MLKLKTSQKKTLKTKNAEKQHVEDEKSQKNIKKKHRKKITSSDS